MDLEIVTEAEAEQKPVGRARDDPNQYPKLDPPKYAYVIYVHCVPKSEPPKHFATATANLHRFK